MSKVLTAYAPFEQLKQLRELVKEPFVFFHMSELGPEDDNKDFQLNRDKEYSNPKKPQWRSNPRPAIKNHPKVRDRLGLFPFTRYNTPAGIYGYPLNQQYHDKLVYKRSKGVEFKDDADFVHVFQVDESARNKMLLISKYDESNADRDLPALKSIFEQSGLKLEDQDSATTFEQLKEIAFKEARIRIANKPLVFKVWNLMRLMAAVFKWPNMLPMFAAPEKYGRQNQLKKKTFTAQWTKILLKLGYTGVWDDECYGLIFPSEYCQAVILPGSKYTRLMVARVKTLRKAAKQTDATKLPDEKTLPYDHQGMKLVEKLRAVPPHQLPMLRKHPNENVRKFVADKLPAAKLISMMGDESAPVRAAVAQRLPVKHLPKMMGDASDSVRSAVANRISLKYLAKMLNDTAIEVRQALFRRLPFKQVHKLIDSMSTMEVFDFYKRLQATQEGLEQLPWFYRAVVDKVENSDSGSFANEHDTKAVVTLLDDLSSRVRYSPDFRTDSRYEHFSIMERLRDSKNPVARIYYIHSTPAEYTLKLLDDENAVVRRAVYAKVLKSAEALKQESLFKSISKLMLKKLKSETDPESRKHLIAILQRWGFNDHLAKQSHELGESALSTATSAAILVKVMKSRKTSNELWAKAFRSFIGKRVDDEDGFWNHFEEVAQLALRRKNGGFAGAIADNVTDAILSHYQLHHVLKEYSIDQLNVLVRVIVKLLPSSELSGWEASRLLMRLCGLIGAAGKSNSANAAKLLEGVDSNQIVDDLVAAIMQNKNLLSESTHSNTYIDLLQSLTLMPKLTDATRINDLYRHLWQRAEDQDRAHAALTEFKNWYVKMKQIKDSSKVANTLEGAWAGSGLGGTLHKPTLKPGEGAKLVAEGKELHGWDKYVQLVAEAYAKAPLKDEAALPSFRVLKKHTIKLFPKIRSRVRVKFVDGQPYDTAEEMIQKVKATRTLLVSKDFNQDGFFGPEVNLMFRAVHDYFAHMNASFRQRVRSFGIGGELEAYNKHIALIGCQSRAVAAVFTEVIGQASHYLHFGKFPKQKLVTLSDFDHCKLGLVKGYEIKDGDLVPVRQKLKKVAGTTRLVLWRAAKDDHINSGTSFSESREAAEVYLNNPGYGGPNLYRAVVQVNSNEVLDLAELGEVEAHEKVCTILADCPPPRGIGIDEWVPRIAYDLAEKGIAWVRVNESHPRDSITWIWTAPSGRWDVDEAIKPVSSKKRTAVAELPKKPNGRPQFAIIGDDQGRWEISQDLLKREPGKWVAIAGITLQNNWKSLSVDHATEHHAGFKKALHEAVQAYPELREYLCIFDGNKVTVEELLNLRDAAFNLTALTYYHGTSTAHWEKIQKTGLSPRNVTNESPSHGSRTQALESNPRLVYLTTQANTCRFAARDAVNNTKSKGVILQVDASNLRESKFRPDEDSQETSAIASVQKYGVVAYEGTIPASALKVHAVLEDGQWKQANVKKTGSDDRDRKNVLDSARDFPENLLPNLHEVVPPQYMKQVPYRPGQTHIVVYRAVPAGVTEIRPGDWVALSSRYAKVHDRGGTVLSKKVPVEHVMWAGTDMNEWFYVPLSKTASVMEIIPDIVRKEASNAEGHHIAHYTLTCSSCGGVHQCRCMRSKVAMPVIEKTALCYDCAKKPAKTASTLPVVNQRDLYDAIEHASQVYAEGGDFDLDDFTVSTVKVIPVEDLYNVDDIDAWLDFESGELRGLSRKELLSELSNFRSNWRDIEEVKEWIKTRSFPPIVIVEGVDFEGRDFATIGDGRGRVNLAIGLGWKKVPVVVLTQKPVKKVQASGGTLTLYHLTNSAKFKLKKIVPTDNALSMHSREAPGLYLATNVEPWINGHGYIRPFVVEIVVPKDSVVRERWGGELFLPAENFKAAKITRVIPLDAWAREKYDDWGWTEEWFQTTFDTEEPLPPKPQGPGYLFPRNPFPFKNWRFKGDVRSMDSAWVAKYKKRVGDYMREKRKTGSTITAGVKTAMPPVPEEWKGKVFYHGTPTEAAAKSIMEQGLIIPPDLTKQKKHMLTPVDGRVYLTPSISYALIYALGGDIAGHEVPGWVDKTHGRYGYVFAVSAEQLGDIQSDEDSVGKLLHTQLNSRQIDPWWLVPLAKDIVAPNRLARLKQGEWAYFASVGKQILRYLHKNKEHAKIKQLLHACEHIAHQGPVKPTSVWRVDKLRSKEFKRDGSNFFEVAKQVRMPKPKSINKLAHTLFEKDRACAVELFPQTYQGHEYTPEKLAACWRQAGLQNVEEVLAIEQKAYRGAGIEKPVQKLLRTTTDIIYLADHDREQYLDSVRSGTYNEGKCRRKYAALVDAGLPSRPWK